MNDYRALMLAGLIFASGCGPKTESAAKSSSAEKSSESKTTTKPVERNVVKLHIEQFENALVNYTRDLEKGFPKGAGADVLPGLAKQTQPESGPPRGPYITKAPVDPWGTPYHYEFPSKRFPKGDKPAIWSYGPNRQNDNGEKDDINNWSEK